MKNASLELRGNQQPNLVDEGLMRVNVCVCGADRADRGPYSYAYVSPAKRNQRTMG